MPDGRTHDIITVVTALGANVAYFALAKPPSPLTALLFTGAYLFAGFACAGDLDLDSREYRRWGPLRCIWWPYRVCVPHRSWISHGLILGGIIRAGYLAVVTTILFWLALWSYSRLGPHVDASAITQQGWQSLTAYVHTHPQWAAALLLGFILAGTTHSVADIVSTGLKRAF